MVADCSKGVRRCSEGTVRDHVCNYAATGASRRAATCPKQPSTYRRTTTKRRDMPFIFILQNMIYTVLNQSSPLFRR